MSGSKFKSDESVVQWATLSCFKILCHKSFVVSSHHVFLFFVEFLNEYVTLLCHFRNLKITQSSIFFFKQAFKEEWKSLERDN